MKALYFDGDSDNPNFELIEIENDLKALQEKVGGYIECVTVDEGRNVVICDENGRFKSHKTEFVVRGITFVGKVLLVGVLNDEFCDYKSEQPPPALRNSRMLYKTKALGSNREPIR